MKSWSCARYTNTRAVLLSEAQIEGNYKVELVQRQNKEVMEWNVQSVKRNGGKVQRLFMEAQR